MYLQVITLTKKGLNACFLGGDQTDEKVIRDAWSGMYDIVFMTPDLAVLSTKNLEKLHGRRVRGWPSHFLTLAWATELVDAFS